MAPAAPTSLPALLSSLTQSLSSALDATARVGELDPAEGGISLLDVKNELLLSYLQNLVFIIILKIRHARDGLLREAAPEKSGKGGSAAVSFEDVARKLVELRLYLEKGSGPLEGALKYQIDNLLKAAADADRAANTAGKPKKERQKKPKKVRTGFEDESDLDSSGSEEESDAGSDNDDSDAASVDVEDDDGTRGSANLASFLRPAASSTTGATPRTGLTDPTSSAVYKPPMRRRALMPSDPSQSLPKTSQSLEKRERSGPTRALAIEDYLAHEAPHAPPVAVPSIGTTIREHGRHVLSRREQDEAEARREYEETHLVRLPAPSKKERAKRGQASGKGGRMAFGGEEFRELGSGVDRIERLVRKTKEGGGGKGQGVRALLEKSRKRGAESIGAGAAAVGERYRKKLRLMEKGRGK